jgi:hypothetical protein
METIKKEHPMIPANLDPSVMIKESDRFAYHFRLTYLRVPPNDPTHPIKKVTVRAIRVCDYEKYFHPRLGTERLIQARKAIGADTMDLVHDPSNLLKEKKPAPTVPEQVKSEHDRKRAKQPATIGDIQQALAEKK